MTSYYGFYRRKYAEEVARERRERILDEIAINDAKRKATEYLTGTLEGREIAAKHRLQRIHGQNIARMSRQLKHCEMNGSGYTKEQLMRIWLDDIQNGGK